MNGVAMCRFAGWRLCRRMEKLVTLQRRRSRGIFYQANGKAELFRTSNGRAAKSAIQNLKSKIGMAGVSAFSQSVWARRDLETSFRLSVSSFQLSVSSFQLLASSCRFLLSVSSCQFPVVGFQLSADSFQIFGGGRPLVYQTTISNNRFSAFSACRKYQIREEMRGGFGAGRNIGL